MVASTMCLSISTEFYQFLLSFGVLGGISASLVFYSSVSAVGHWFAHRRSLATGIALSAGGLGGVCYPLIILYLGPSIGFAWAIRIIGLFNTLTGLLACLLVRKRLPPNKAKGAVIDLKALKEVKYAVVTISTFVLEVALIVPYTYISSYAIAQGMAPQSAYLLNTIFSAAAIPGRILPNYFADRYGVFNVMIITTVACTIFIFGLWLPAGNVGEPAITAFVVLFGFWSGSSISLSPVCIGQVCETEDYGKRTGTTFCIASLGSLIGPPIAGAILENAGGSYLGVIVMAGVMYAIAMAAYVWARQLVKPGGLQRQTSS